MSEEEFQKKLDKCNSEQERAALITETLNDLYDESADKYKELNKDIIAANEAQDRINKALADVGGALEPFVTKGKILVAEVLERLIPLLEWAASTVLPWVSAAVSAVVDWFGQMVGKVTDTGVTVEGTMVWIQEAFQAAWTFIQEYWNAIGAPIWELIQQNVGLVADYFKERMPQIQEFVQECFTDIQNLWNAHLKPALTAVGDFIRNVLAPAFKWVFENVITPVVDVAFKTIGILWSNNLMPIFESMIDFIKNIFSGNFAAAFQNVLDAVAAVWDGIKTVVKTPINAAIALINKFIESINGIKIPDWVPGMGGTGVLNLPTIPYLYAGGVLERGQVGILEGSGAEAVVPLENNRKWTRAVAEDMNDALGGGNTETLLNELIDLQRRTLRLLAAGQTIVLNEREVARTVRTYA